MQKSKKAAARAVKTKIRRLTEFVEIEYGLPPYEDLFGSERQKVNYLRHGCTLYEYTLGHLYGAADRHEAYPIIRGRILKEIAERYPKLAQGARRQDGLA